MKCVLMNKYKEIAILEYNNVLNGFDKIYEIVNIDYAPLIIKNYYDENKDELEFLKKVSDWFRGRGIPSFRDKLDLLLHRLNITTPEELLDKSFGLSLSNQYWIKPYGLDIRYDDINFFDHDFDYSEFLEASLSLNSKTKTREESLKTPNNTTDGMLKKAWIIENKERFLLKSGYKNDILEPFNEVLASEISRRLGFNHVEYTLDTYKDMVVSKCPCFINKDTEFVTAFQIRSAMIRHDDINDYEDYIKKLEQEGIVDARIKLENMYILDFLIMNEDRHLNNFGIIRDVNTLKWLDVAPIFDNGESLKIEYYDDEELIIKGEGRFFYEVLPFDNIIKVVKDIKRIDVDKLDGLVEWFSNLLHQYQDITHIPDKRIDRLCILLDRQIRKIKNMS